MDSETAGLLAEKGVTSRDALADLAVDELTELTGIPAERAQDLIMKARAHWFESEEAHTAAAREGAVEGRTTMAQTTIEQFATELKMPSGALLEQLAKAGVAGKKEGDRLSEPTRRGSSTTCANRTAGWS